MQISYIIYFTNIINKINIIYYFLIKYKQVIYSILAIKLYKIVHKFDIKLVIKKILEKIFRSIILLILYANLKFLYNNLVKLATI